MELKISKEFRMLVPLLVSALVLFLFVIDDVSGATKRNYSKGLKLAKEIYSEQAFINPHRVLELLSSIKSAMLDSLTMDIITHSIKPEEQSILVQALGLARLTEVNWENCFYDHKIILHGNLHQKNYLELNEWLIGVYKSENLQQLIRNYFEAQSLICKHGVVAHFGLKLKELRGNVTQLDKFVELLNFSFPEEVPVNELTLDHKIYGIVQMIKMFYPIHELEKTKKMHGNFSYHFNFQLKGDCSFHLLVPLGTMMMTFERLERPEPLFTTKYSDIIRAYELCALLNRMTPEEEIALRNRFTSVFLGEIYAAKVGYQARVDEIRNEPNLSTIPAASINNSSDLAGPSNVNDQPIDQRQQVANQGQKDDDDWLKLRL